VANQCLENPVEEPTMEPRTLSSNYSSSESEPSLSELLLDPRLFGGPNVIKHWKKKRSCRGDILFAWY